MSLATTTSIIVPLYIYPLTAQTWEPLYTAIDTYPSTEFLVIVNPNSGPGSTPTPDERYAQEIPRLNVKPNVQTIGYVSTRYGERDFQDVSRDIATYAGWNTDDSVSGTYVEGVFFDETPNAYTDAIGAYYAAAGDEVERNDGFPGERTLVHNPGTLPDQDLARHRPAVTVIFEESYATYQRIGQQLSTENYDRDSSSIIVHSVPLDRIETLVEQLARRAKYVFVTDLDVDYYNSFGPGWETFVRAVAGSQGGEGTITTTSTSDTATTATEPVMPAQDTASAAPPDPTNACRWNGHRCRTKPRRSDPDALV